MLRFFISWSFCILISSFASAGTVDTDEVDRRIKALMNKTDLTGLAVAIIEDGDISFAQGYGETLKGSGDKVTADTVFRWASISKSMAAATILSLSEDGYIGLTSPAIAHAPSLNLPKSQNVVTVEDILTHQTGIVRNAYDTRVEDGYPAKDIRSSLESLPRICEPGECHTYQNVAFDAAAEMVETAIELPYKSVVNERFFIPLGMSTASITLDGLTRSKSWAKPHQKDGRVIDEVKPTYYRLPAAAGVNSSVADLGKWVMVQMDENHSVLSQLQQEALQTPRVSTPRENRIMRRFYHALKDAHYGLGWRIYDYEGHKVIGHRGAVQGYRASVLFDPELKSGVAVMWNSSHSRPNGLNLEIMDQIYDRPKRDWMRLSQG